MVALVQAFVLALLCVCGHARGEAAALVVGGSGGAGFRTTVTQAGLNYFSSVGSQVLQQNLKNIQISSMTAHTNTPIGQVQIKLNNFQMNNIQVGQDSIQVLPGEGLEFLINNLGGQGKCDWKVTHNGFPHISDGGNAHFQMSGTKIKVSLKITESGDKLQVDAKVVNFQFGNLQITVGHTSLAWLQNAIIKAFHGRIVSEISSVLNQNVQSAINNGLNKALSELPYTAPVNADLEINYATPQNPDFNQNPVYMSWPSMGQFEGAGSHKGVVCPASICPPPSTLPNTISSDQVTMVVDQFMANTASYVYYKVGAIQATVTPKQVSHLNTTYLGKFIPPLKEKFPNSQLNLDLKAAAPPLVTVKSSTGMQLTFPGEIQVMAYNGSATPNPANQEAVFDIDGEFVVAANFSVQEKNSRTYLRPHFNALSIKFNVTNSKIGPITKIYVQAINDVLNLALSDAVVPLLNIVGDIGFQLPTVPGLSFQSPKLSWGNGYLAVATNVKYSPQ